MGSACTTGTRLTRMFFSGERPTTTAARRERHVAAATPPPPRRRRAFAAADPPPDLRRDLGALRRPFRRPPLGALTSLLGVEPGGFLHGRGAAAVRRGEPPRTGRLLLGGVPAD